MNQQSIEVDIDMTFEFMSVPEDLVVCLELDNCVRDHPDNIRLG